MKKITIKGTPNYTPTYRPFIREANDGDKAAGAYTFSLNGDPIGSISFDGKNFRLYLEDEVKVLPVGAEIAANCSTCKKR